jgi:hypothetical protein
MSLDRLEELLWSRVDGTIGSEELKELDDLMVEHPESGELERQITEIVDRLDKLERRIPPLALRARIDEALAESEPSTSPIPVTRVPSATSVRDSLRWMAPAACLLIGFAVGYLIRPGAGWRIDESQVAGTMQPTADAQIEALAEIEFGAGRVAAHRVGSEVEVDIDLADGHELGLSLEAAAGELRIANFSSDGSPSAVAKTEGDSVDLQLRGPARLDMTVTAADDAGSIDLDVSVDGESIAERRLNGHTGEAGE